MPALDPVAAVYLLLVGIFFPVVCIRSSVRVARGKPFAPFRVIHGSTLIVLGSLALFAVIVARRVGMPLFPRPRFDLTLTLLAGAGVAALLIVGAIRWRFRLPESRARLVAMLPRAPGDYVWWAAVSVMAGVGEEVIYRGVLYGTLEYLTGSWLAAAILAAIVFGACHALQGWGAAVVTFVIALLQQWLVFRAGDLYLAMAAHFTYDMAAGFMYSSLARRAGLFTVPGLSGPPARASPPGL